MNAARLHLLLHVFLSAGALVHAFDPSTTSVFAGVCAVGAFSAFLGLTIYDNNYLHQSCDAKWIFFNATGLQVDLQSKLFGQHIASRIILNNVTRFMNNNNRKKPLVLSLHGPTGTGKNFVSQLIADNIYKEGMESSFVHFFTSVHFPYLTHVDTYKSQLQQWIKGNVTNCGRSMFIFDEMDKMHPGIMDGIKPYLDYNQMLDGVSYGKAIFIFLSNDGGETITKAALNFWKAGRAREELELKDLETVLSKSVFNNKQSGLWHTSLNDKNLVDFFVPFLPLESRHVVQCVLAEMKARGIPTDQNVAERVAKDGGYLQKTERVFSVKGCKTISNKLDYYI